MSLTDRPCGECRELVPADTGCEHWAPVRDAVRTARLRVKSEQRHEKARKDHRTGRAQRAQQLADEFRAMIGQPPPGEGQS